MPRKSQISFEIEALLYSRPIPWDRLAGVLDSAMRAGAKELRVKLLLSETPLPRMLASIAGPDSGRLRQFYHHTDAWAGHLQGRFGRERPITVQGSFFVQKHPKYPRVWVLVTDAQTDFLKRPLRNLLRSLSDRPTAPILRTPEIATLLKYLEARQSLQPVRVTQLGYRSRITSAGATKAVERDRKWTDLGIAEAFADAIEAGQWVTDASVEYKADGYRTAHAKIGRYGVFTFAVRCGSALESFIDPATRLANDWYDFLRNRERAKPTNFRSRPFSITFDTPALGSIEHVSLLRAALQKLPSVSCSVLHGNPYFHVAMLDYQDGSTYEVLVLDPASITVIPQGRTTVRALQRLCAQIFADFREGRLLEIEHAAG